MNSIEIEMPDELYDSLKAFISNEVTNKESPYYIDTDRYIELRNVTESMAKLAITKTTRRSDGSPEEICVVPNTVESYFEATGGVWPQEPGLTGRNKINKLYNAAYKELKLLGIGHCSKVGLCTALWIELCKNTPLFERLLEWAQHVVAELEKKKEVHERIGKMHKDIDVVNEQVDMRGVREELEKIPVPGYVYDDNRKYYIPIFHFFNVVLKDLGIPFAQPMRVWDPNWLWYPEYPNWCDRDYDIANEKTKGASRPYERIRAGKKTSDEEHSAKVEVAIRVLDTAIGDATPQIEISLPGPERLPRLVQKIDADDEK